MKTKKELFIKELFYSIKNFDYYKEIYNHNISRAFKYLAILILLYSVVATVIITYETNKVMENAQNFIETEIENVNYSAGELEVNNNEKKSYFNDYIVIDTSIDNLDEYSSSIILVRDKFRFALEGRNFDFRYDSFITQSFDKQALLDALNIKHYILLIVLTTFIISYIVLFISTLLDVLVISFIGFIISSIIGNNNCKFRNTFNIASHSITLSVIMAMIYLAINTFTGFEIKYFSTLYTSLATIYTITAILLIKSENNKNNT